MSFLGELSEFIRLRKKHYLLPILIPIVVIRALLVLPKASIGIFRDIESRCEAALWESASSSQPGNLIPIQVRRA